MCSAPFSTPWTASSTKQPLLPVSCTCAGAETPWPPSSIPPSWRLLPMDSFPPLRSRSKLPQRRCSLLSSPWARPLQASSGFPVPAASRARAPSPSSHSHGVLLQSVSFLPLSLAAGAAAPPPMVGLPSPPRLLPPGRAPMPGTAAPLDRCSIFSPRSALSAAGGHGATPLLLLSTPQNSQRAGASSPWTPTRLVPRLCSSPWSRFCAELRAGARHGRICPLHGRPLLFPAPSSLYPARPIFFHGKPTASPLPRCSSWCPPAVRRNAQQATRRRFPAAAPTSPRSAGSLFFLKRSEQHAVDTRRLFAVFAQTHRRRRSPR
jgi:hypothetical protein